MSHSLRTIRVSFRAIKFLTCASFICSALAPLAVGEEQSVSEPLDEPIMIHERLVSNESEEVPPEPVPPPASYESIDVLTPALVAEQILRLRDSLGEEPLSGRPGFQLLPLMNETEEGDTSHSDLAFDVEERAETEHAAPAPWQRDEDRRMLGERLRGMASRPMVARTRSVPQAPFGTQHAYPPNIEDAYPPTVAPQALPTAPSCPESPRFDFNTGIRGHVHDAQPFDLASRYSPGPPTPPIHPPYGRPGTIENPQIKVLRESARQLEESAHTLECEDQFERADQIRELAQQLRQDARHLREDASSARYRPVRPVVGVQESQSCGNCPGTPEIPRNTRIPQFYRD